MQPDHSPVDAFKERLDHLLLDSVVRFNLKPQYMMRHQGFHHASALANAVLWLRDIPVDHLHRLFFLLVTLPYRRCPEALLRRRLRSDAVQRTYHSIIERFSYLYERLDSTGRELLLHVAAVRLLGPRHVLVPGHSARLQRGRRALRAALRQSAPLPASGEFIFDLRPFPALGFPAQCAMHRLMLADLLLLGQYDHSDVHVEPGDVVLDGGAFKGETSLWLACRAGEGGKVLAFEFVPAHTAGLGENLARNPALQSRVEIVPAALWSRSGIPVYATQEGGSASISFDAAGGGTRVAETVTIDDFVARRTPARLDLIKLDIEGAELETLKGAEHTLRTLRPKLAISVYHSLDDFDAIPRFIDGLGAGYRFRLGHHTFGAAETVLYATARGKN